MVFDVRDQCDPERLARAIRGGAVMVPRVEVHAENQVKSYAAPILSGSVTHEWVTGVTRTLNLSVPPTAAWDRWLSESAALELRPYVGVRVSSRLTVECPMGRFQYWPAVKTRPHTDAVTIQCQDYWSRLVNSGRPARVFNFGGLVTDAITQLMISGWLWTPTVTVGKDRVIEPMMLDKSRHEVIAEWAAAIGAEVFMDRFAEPIIRDIPVLGSSTTEAITGELGTVTGMTETINREVVNEVASWSTAQGVDFPEQVASITWSEHPAYKDHVGPRRKEFSSPLLLTEQQAMEASWSILTKESARARVMTYERLPDPTTDAGDSMLGQLLNGATEVQQVSKIVTPLGRGLQTISGVSTRLDDQ